MQPKRVVIQRGAIEPHILPPRRRSSPVGRIVAVVVVLLIAAAGGTLFALSRLPHWRAERVRLSIGTGVKLAAVETLLSGIPHEVVYQERMAVGWLRRNRDEFLTSFAEAATQNRGERRLRLTFRGPLGNSVSLIVEFNAQGEVAAVRAPGAEE